MKKGKVGRVLVNGWVHEVRNLGKVRFLILKDPSGILQVTAHKDKIKKQLYDFMLLPRETVVSVSGVLKRNKKAPGGREIIPDKITLLGEAKHPLPIDTSDFSKTDLPKRLDYRFLDLRTKRTQAIFTIQSCIANSFHEYFYKNDFVEIQTPSIISSASEGGTELFSVKYFEKSAYLAQSPQLYKQMAACSLEKVFTVTPVWRAEKHNTVRHLNESRQMDIEMAFSDDKVVMKELVNVVKYMVKKVIKECKQELEILKLKLEVPKAKYLTYKEAVQLLRKKKVKIKDGEDFNPKAEEKLCELFKNNVVLVHDWPLSLKPFYIMPKDEKMSKGFDALYGGIEIASGGQRVHIPNLLIKRLKANRLNPKNFTHYVNSFRYGSPEHSGWSVGLERFTMALLGLENIREACMFPRDRDRIVP